MYFFFYHDDIFYFITCLTCIVVSIHFRLSWTLSSQTSSPFRTDTKNLQRKMLNWSKHCLLPLKRNSSMWYWSSDFQEWSACYFSLQYHPCITHWGHEKKRSDHQQRKPFSCLSNKSPLSAPFIENSLENMYSDVRV